MFYLDYYPDPPERPNGFKALSTSSDWVGWLICVIPAGIHDEVKNLFISNTKHILVGLEMKAGLTIPHAEKFSGISVLFEPYAQIMCFEFCVGVFSLCEGLGSLLHFEKNGTDGSGGHHVKPADWISALASEFDTTGSESLAENVEIVRTVRNLMHQDKLGLRSEIDWHSFDYEHSFIPALNAIQCLLNHPGCVGRVPKNTNLTYER